MDLKWKSESNEINARIPSLSCFASPVMVIQLNRGFLPREDSVVMDHCSEELCLYKVSRDAYIRVCMGAGSGTERGNPTNRRLYSNENKGILTTDAHYSQNRKFDLTINTWLQG